MKQEDFFEALGDMDDKYIQEAKEEGAKGTTKAEKEEDADKTCIRKKKVETSWKKEWKWVSLAACLCLLLGAEA